MPDAPHFLILFSIQKELHSKLFGSLYLLARKVNKLKTYQDNNDENLGIVHVALPLSNPHKVWDNAASSRFLPYVSPLKTWQNRVSAIL
ncbi:Uncharacterised protein [Chlamydia abortus]|nr:Uncharacterised protein [Chlamydia abortus]